MNITQKGGIDLEREFVPFLVEGLISKPKLIFASSQVE